MEILKKIFKVKTKEVKKFKATHPKHGYVVFSDLTRRQFDIMRMYQNIADNNLNYPNDQEFGKFVRSLFNKAALKRKKK